MRTRTHSVNKKRQAFTIAAGARRQKWASGHLFSAASQCAYNRRPKFRAPPPITAREAPSTQFSLQTTSNLNPSEPKPVFAPTWAVLVSAFVPVLVPHPSSFKLPRPTERRALTPLEPLCERRLGPMSARIIPIGFGKLFPDRQVGGAEACCWLARYSTLSGPFIAR